LNHLNHAIARFGFGLSLSRFSLSFTPTLNADRRPVVLSSTVTSNVTFTVVARGALGTDRNPWFPQENEKDLL
jgi:hypothetical protein